jgi:hypothetical protein
MKKRKTKRIAATDALVSVTVLFGGLYGPALAPTPVFEGNMTVPAKNGPTQPVHIRVMGDFWPRARNTFARLLRGASDQWAYCGNG